MFKPEKLYRVMNTIEKSNRINKTPSSLNISIVGIFGLFLFFTWSYAVQAVTNECMTCVTHGGDRTECTPLPCPPPRGFEVDLGPYQSVASILAKVKQNSDLMDTIHKNPFILEAAGLFLDLADSNGLPEEDLEFVFSRFFPNSKWYWAPITNIKRAQKGLYIMSIGGAVSTQDSSLYLFEERTHHKIDSGKRGCITIEDVSTEGTVVTVRYNTHMSQPKTATLTKEGATWTVTHTQKER